jgi:DNA-binding transcriptional ArsR family regulator
MSTIFKALADPTRRRVLELLRRQPMTAGALAAEFPISGSTMSSHFTVLRDANLVVSEKQGKTVVYHLQLSVLEEALLGFADLLGLQHRATATASSPPPANKELHE